MLSKKRFLFPILVTLVAGLWFSANANAGFYMREEARPMWVKADTNRDGYLSRPEVYAEDPQLLDGFDDADINHDGKLDLGEFEILLISL
ncbi:MAG: hypothetical protein PVH25_05595 [Burkholderiales bacterium]